MGSDGRLSAPHDPPAPLAKSADRHRIVLETAMDGYLFVDAQGRILEVNSAYCRMSGYGEAELLAMRIPDLEVNDPEAEVAARIARIKERGAERFETRHRRKDGTLRDVEVSIQLLPGEGGLMMGFTRDITERRRAEAALAERESTYRSLFDQITHGIYLHDERGVMIDANPSACAQSGYTRDELLRLNVFEHLVESPGRTVLTNDEVRRLWAAWNIGDRFTVEAEHRRKDGTVYPVRVTTGAIRYGAGKAILAVVEDITERRRAEAASAADRDLLANLARLVPGVIYQYRLFPDGRSCFPYSSPGMLDIYEIPPEEVREDATPVFGRLHPEDLARVSEAIFASARTLETFFCEFRVILPRQGLRWRHCQAHPERTADGGTLWHGIITDFTERKRAEEALAESEVKREKLIANIGDVLVIIDKDGINRYKSPNLTRFFGWKPEELVGAPSLDVVHPDDLALARAFISGLLGEPGVSRTTECRYRCKDGTYRWIEFTGVNLLDDPAIRGILGNYHDISERKRAEEENARLEGRLQQAQKLESVGRLAGGVAHDYNNMLAVILGNAELLAESPTLSPQERESLEGIRNAAAHSAELTRQLLTFARKQVISPRALDLNEVLEGKIKMLRRMVGENIRLEWTPAPGLWPVHMDPTQFDQILINLCINARDAIDGVGRIVLETGTSGRGRTPPTARACPTFRRATA